jgi:predicted RNA-binding Zn-ribbon protein involved in translation (DUF1610 family)
MSIGVLREVVDYMTDCPLCGEVSLSIVASDECDTSRTVVGCDACGVRIECALGTLRRDEVRRALGALTNDPHAPAWFKQSCALLHKAACVIDLVEEEK